MASHIVCRCLIAECNSDVVIAQRRHIRCAIETHQTGGDNAVSLGGSSRDCDLFGKTMQLIRLAYIVWNR